MRIVAGNVVCQSTYSQAGVLGPSPIRPAGAYAPGKASVCKNANEPLNTAAGKCFLDMLGVFAEFETNLRRERQLEGIANAKARGVYKGRKASIDPAKVKQMKADGMGPPAIAKALGIGRASVYRALEAD